MRQTYGFNLFPMPKYRPARVGRWRVKGYWPSWGPGYVTPSVLEARTVLSCAGKVWMSTGLMEQESHAWHVHCGHGTVVAAGLGLGMFAFAASAKPEVQRVVVAEVAPEVLRLVKASAGFEAWPCRDKIRLVEVDALAPDFADRMLAATEGMSPDYFFADIWPNFPAAEAPAATAMMGGALGAKAAGWWGQELSFGLWCIQAARWPDESALRNYFTAIGVAAHETAGYAAFCRDAMAIHGFVR